MAKATKLRPYRVDYFNHAEMEGSKALLRSEMTRATTSAEAKADFAAEGRTIVKASRYYKKLSAKPKLVSVAKLMSPRKAAALLKSLAEPTYSVSFHYVDAAGQETPVTPEEHHEEAQELMKEDLYGGTDEPAPQLAQLSDDYHTMFDNSQLQEAVEEEPVSYEHCTDSCCAEQPEAEAEPECCNAGPAPISYEEPKWGNAAIWIVGVLAVLALVIMAYCRQ
jgi:hypothetical protein